VSYTDDEGLPSKMNPTDEYNHVCHRAFGEKIMSGSERYGEPWDKQSFSQQYMLYSRRRTTGRREGKSVRGPCSPAIMCSLGGDRCEGLSRDTVGRQSAVVKCQIGMVECSHCRMRGLSLRLERRR
jgi:hypothetical protein